MEENYAVQVEIYTEALRIETNKLRRAIIDEIYDPRSIVGDCTLRMETYLAKLEELVSEHKPSNLNKDKR